VRPEGLCKLKKLIHVIGSRSRYLPACIRIPSVKLRPSLIACKSGRGNLNNSGFVST
jgi:hypothetical protein